MEAREYYSKGAGNVRWRFCPAGKSGIAPFLYMFLHYTYSVTIALAVETRRVPILLVMTRQQNAAVRREIHTKPE